jgi:hypothetical protein
MVVAPEFALLFWPWLVSCQGQTSFIILISLINIKMNMKRLVGKSLGFAQFTEKSFHRINLTERHLTEKSVGRTLFDRKFILPNDLLTEKKIEKGRLTETIFDKKYHLTQKKVKQRVVWPKFYLAEKSFDQKVILSKAFSEKRLVDRKFIWPKVHFTDMKRRSVKKYRWNGFSVKWTRSIMLRWNQIYNVDLVNQF